MSTDYNQPAPEPFDPSPQQGATAQQAEWGAPQQRPAGPRWTGRKTVAAIAIALGIAAAGGVAVYAASGTNSASQGGPGGMGGPGGQLGGPGGQLGGPGGQLGGMGLANALHGEFVVSDGNNGYTTELMQTGEVTAVSSSSISLKSADGYTKMYTVTSDTTVGNGNSDISSVKTGASVTVIATKSGDAATAKSVLDRSTMRNQQGGNQQGGPGGQMGGQQGGQVGGGTGI